MMASDEIVHAAQIEFGFADCFYVFVVCEAFMSEDVCGLLGACQGDEAMDI